MENLFKQWIEELEEVATDINKLLFTPPLNTPIKTIELPIGGHGYGAEQLPLIYDFVNLANNLPVDDASKYKALQVEKEVPDESGTLKLITNTLRLAKRITGDSSSSFGLHPAVYFYSANGRHQPTAVLAMSALIMDLEKKNEFNVFCDARAALEEFLLEHKDFINQMSRKTGSMAKGYRILKEYYEFVINCISEGNHTHEKIEKLLLTSDRFSFLLKTNPIISVKAKPFSSNTKQRAFLEEALDAAVTCNICGARKDNKSMQADHIVDLEHGGPGNLDNLQYVHPYCNSTFKYYVENK